MDTKTLVIGGGIVGVVVLVVLWQARKDVIRTVSATATAINPANQNNIFASEVNQIGATATGNSSFSLGAWIYDMTHQSSMTP